MLPERRIIRMYSDRELLICAVERIAEKEFRCEAFREKPEANTPETAGQPAAIIIDFQSGLRESIRRLSTTFRRVPVIVWQRSKANEPSLNALDWGASGVLHDHSSQDDILACLKSVTGGCAWIPDSVAQAASRSRRCHLSRREGQLLSLVVQGLRNKEIAYHLKITEGTVKVYFSRLFQKLGVSDRYELALLGLRHFMPDSLSMSNAATQPSQIEPLNSIYINRTLGFEPGFMQQAAPTNIARL